MGLLAILNGLFVLSVVLTVVVICLALYYQKWFLYLPQVGLKFRVSPWHPSRPEDAPLDGPYSLYSSPKQYGLDYETLTLTTIDNCRLEAWFMKSDILVHEAPTLVFFHGNAGNIALRLPVFASLIGYLHCNILAIDYRGYGNSTGTPTETGLIRDAECALRYIFARQDIDKNKIFIFGRSLGGSVAIAAAAIYQQYDVKGVILENTFLNVEQFLKDKYVSRIMTVVLGMYYTLYYKMYPKALPSYISLQYTKVESVPSVNRAITEWTAFIVKQVVRRVVTLSWKNSARIHMVKPPVLFLSGRKDKLVPPQHMDKLYELYMKSHTADIRSKAGRTNAQDGNEFDDDEAITRLVEFADGGHNDTWTKPGYKKVISDFINGCLDNPQQKEVE